MLNVTPPPLFPLPAVAAVQFDGYLMLKPTPVYVFSTTEEEVVGAGFEAVVGVVLVLEPPVLQAAGKNATNNREQSAISRSQ